MSAHRSGFLGMVVRGIRSRRLLSAGSILLIALAVGSAVLGPVFQVAVVRSYVVTRINDAPPDATGLSRLFVPDAGLDGGVTRGVAIATTAIDKLDDGPFHDPSISWETARVETPSMRPPNRLVPGEAMLLAKRGACRNLEIDGECPDAPGEAIALAGDLEYAGVAIGDTIRLKGLQPVTLVGSYRVPEGRAALDYWYDLDRLSMQTYHLEEDTGPAGSESAVERPYQPAPLIVTEDSFEGITAKHWRVRLDQAIDIPPDWTDALLPEAAASGKAVAGDPVSIRGGILEGDPIGDLPALIAEADDQQDTARASIAPAVLSMVLVALALLMRLLTAASELRLPELALASLRGVGERRMWALGLVEPLVLGAVGVPLGIALGTGGALVLVRSWLTPGLPLPLPAAAWLATGVVVVAAVAIAVASVGIVLRTSLSAQLTGLRRPKTARRWVVVVELVIVALAAAMLVSKLSGGQVTRPDLVDLVLPVVLAVAAGLIATRLIGSLARIASRRRGRRLSGFVAARALGRRQEGTLVILPLTAAIAVGVFGFGVYSAAADWRTSVAATTSPGHTTWKTAGNLGEAVALTHAIDPEGEHLVAVADLSSPGARLSVVDAPRMARVLTWPPTWSSGKSVTEVQEAISAAGYSPSFAGPSLALAVINDVSAPSNLTVEVQLGTASGEIHKVYLGPVEPGSSTIEADVPFCRQRCTIDRISLGGAAATKIAMAGDFVFEDIAVDGETLDGALVAPAWGRSLGIGSVEDIVTVSDVDGAVRLAIDSGGEPGLVRLVAGQVPDSRPVLKGRDLELSLNADRPELGLQVPLSGVPLPVDPMMTADSMPLTGPAGVLIDYQMLTSDRVVFDTTITPYIVSNESTPAAMRTELADHGVIVATTLARERSILDHGAYALALRLYAVVAALVIAMAAAGLLVSTAVQFPSRRRDAAALRVVGVPRRAVVSAVAREFAIVLGGAAVAGIAAGTIAQYVVLKTVRLGYVEALTTPRLVADIDLPRVAGLGLVAAVAFGLFAFVSASLTVRGARGSTLRENAR